MPKGTPAKAQEGMYSCGHPIGSMVEVPTRSTNFNLDSLLSRRFNFEEDQHEDTSVPLPLRLENALTNNLYIADAYGVGDAMPPKSDWIAWATYISEKFPERAKLLSDEVEKDHLLNGQLLDNLSNETREGYSGSRTYISALNYSLHDAFRRCSLPSPPGINLDAAVSLRGDPLYKAQMRSWSGYKMRVFGLMDIINKAASSEKGQESLDSSLPDIFPAERRKPMTNALTRYLKRNEANYPREYESDGDY